MSSVVKVIKPSGILDGTKASKFREEISNCVEKDKADIIVVDFQDVTFMDSSGLGALVLALKTVRTAQRKLYLCSINDQIKMLFELTSMDRVFQIYKDEDEFREKVLTQS